MAGTASTLIETIDIAEPQRSVSRLSVWLYKVKRAGFRLKQVKKLKEL